MSDSDDTSRGNGDDADGESAFDRFRREVEDLSREEIERRKFEVPTTASGQDSPSRENEASPSNRAGSDADDARHTDSDRTGSGQTPSSGGDSSADPLSDRDRATFERAMKNVDPLDEERGRSAPDPPDPQALLSDGETDDDSPDPLVTPTIPRTAEKLRRIPTLDRSQRALLERKQKWASERELPELNVRGEPRDPALESLASFIMRHARRDTSFGRIIHGRGRQSAGAPVLKPAVLDWLEGPGRTYIRGYVPERQPSGAWGSLIVEILDVDAQQSPSRQ
ncbi:MAG: Smr/MutS family protein [Bradymonadaceae bacterium]